MKLGGVNYGMAKSTRKFVKNVAKDIAKGKPVTDGAMADYEVLKEGMKFSKNPIKNIFNFFATAKQIKKETLEFQQAARLKNPVPEGGYKAFFSKEE